ncbi:class I SAM-dependent methyltransferase [Wenzhouxiangella limi]|nr:class I SAM-dependent methyltransferase [Wenzhouxiangella limi]
MDPRVSPSTSHGEFGPAKAATCPVCREGSAAVFMTLAQRRYWRCPRCLATFLDPDQHPCRSTEREEYDRHQNRVDDPHYQAFLKPALEAVRRRVAAGSRVLDYGCGPGPALGRMLTDADYAVALYDPLYRADAGVLQPGYDAITCTEVAKHFHHPAREFQRLTALLRPGGWLIVMTRFQTDDARFAGWHYRRDPTHVVFYRPETFRHLGRRLGWQVCCTPPHLVEIQRI